MSLLLATSDGRTITTAAMWQQRRKELPEIFAREIYGRVPEAANTINVKWEATGTTEDLTGTIPTIGVAPNPSTLPRRRGSS